MIRRAILTLGILAAAALIAVGVHGYSLAISRETLAIHLSLALGATLTLLLGHCWVVIYLLVLGHGVRRVVGQGGLDPELAASPARLRRRAFPWLFAAAGLTLATFFVGSGALLGDVPAWLHGTLAWASLATQVAAMVVVRRTLAATDALLARVHASLTEAAP